MKCFNIRGYAVKAGSRFKFVPVSLLVLTTALFTMTATAAEFITNGSFESPDLDDKTIFPKGRPFKAHWMTFYGQNFVDPKGPCVYSPSAPPNAEFCNSERLIPGWSIVWSDTLVVPDPNNPGGFLPPEQGRLELQSNMIKTVPGFETLSSAQSGHQKAELDSHDRVSTDPVTGAAVNELDNNVAIWQEFEVCPSAKYQATYWWKSRTNIAGDNDVRVDVNGIIVRRHETTSEWRMETVDFVTDDTGWSSIAFISIGTGSTTGMSLDDVNINGPDPLNCPGECDDCVPGPIVAGVEWVDPATCVACEVWVPIYTKSGKLENPCGICDQADKPVTLELLYDGDDFTSHGQGPDKSSVVPEIVGVFPTSAYIKVLDGNDILWEGAKYIGETFSFPRDTNEPVIEIYDDSNSTLVQTIEFHTSCSQDLDKLDTFGGITIWDATY